MRPNALLAAAAALALVGCATGQAALSESKEIEPDQQIAYRSPAPDTVPVTVVREERWMSPNCPAVVYVQRRPVAFLGPLERVTLHLPVGYELLGVQLDCTGALGFVESLATVESGHPLLYLVGATGHGNFDIYPNTP